MPERTGIVTRAGHICMICGFLPVTKNKYRELQDHLVRKHFNDRIKAVLPIRRPYMCPDPSCTIEGKDWQALMRHYTGKHGVLEAFLREIIDSGLTLPPNPKHAKRNQAKKQQQQQEQQTTDGEGGIVESAPQTDATQPQAAAFRRKRRSHNSTGSASSPESLQHEEEEHFQQQQLLLQQQQQQHHQPQQQQQLALIVKRCRPNGEEAIALIDLKCFLASSTYIPYPEPQLLAAAAGGGDNMHFNVLTEEHHEEEEEDSKDELTLLTQEQMIQQQLAQQQPEQQHFPLATEEESGIRNQDQELKEIEQHLQEEQQQQMQFQLQSSEVIELSDEQFEQTLVPIYVTPSGEVIQLPYLNSVQFQDGSGDYQIVQAVSAEHHHQIFQVQQPQQSDSSNSENYLRPNQVVNSDRVIVEEVPVFAMEHSDPSMQQQQQSQLLPPPEEGGQQQQQQPELVALPTEKTPSATPTDATATTDNSSLPGVKELTFGMY